MNFKFSNLIWGTFLLLAATFILINQFDNFMNIGIGSIIVAILALVFIVQCIANLRFAFLPIPLAVLYVIFQAPLDLPYIQTKYVIIASVLASIGLAIMIPGKNWNNRQKFKCFGRYKNQQMRTENTNEDNYQSIKVNYGTISRRLCANNLETVELFCNFGAMEIFLDQAVLSSKGAIMDINCSFGAITLLIPRHWKIIDQMSCSLGGVEIDKYFINPAADAPQLTLTGNVSLGGVEIRSI